MVDRTETLLTPACANLVPQLAGESGFELRVQIRLMEDRLLGRINSNYVQQVEKRLPSLNRWPGIFRLTKTPGRMDFHLTYLPQSRSPGTVGIEQTSEPGCTAEISAQGRTNNSLYGDLLAVLTSPLVDRIDTNIGPRVVPHRSDQEG